MTNEKEIDLDALQDFLRRSDQGGQREYDVDGKKIVVCSLSKARQFTDDQPWAAISITTHAHGPGNGWPELNEENRKACHQTAFPDYEFARPGGAADPDGLLFDREDAKEIWDFVDMVWPNIETMMIHCHAGMSRSPAVAAAIAFVKGADHNQFWNAHMPNTLVFGTLLDEAYSRGKISELPTPRKPEYDAGLSWDDNPNFGGN